MKIGDLHPVTPSSASAAPLEQYQVIAQLQCVRWVFHTQWEELPQPHGLNGMDSTVVVNSMEVEFR
jgi:hypothetical protein